LTVGIGIGTGTGVVIEVAIRETVGISEISEMREIGETSMVTLGTTEKTAGLRTAEIDGKTTVASTLGRIAVKSHLPSLHESCRRNRKRFSLVSSPVR
jgi:predicted DNA-binding protein with PD1-like motif